MFQGYAMVSHWQAMGYINQFGLPAEHVRILRNAASPMILAAQQKDPWYMRGTPPTLAYTSTPFRGLDVLIMAFPMIRTMVPDVRLKVYSSMGIYGQSDEEDQFRALYELAKVVPGVEYVGPLPQAQLAEALTDVDYLAYPSTFAETSCIAVIEAMAAGAHVISTGLGALPETTSGFATIVDQIASHPIMFATRYAKVVAETILTCNPQEAFTRRTNQMELVKQVYNWTDRAKTWNGWLAEIISANG
jgi:glycosyltransferase involved in cell wall biosynthesis